MMTDPIADLLSRIKNGYLARVNQVRIPFSNLKQDIVRILHKNGHVVSYEIVEQDGKKEISVTLNDVRKTKYIPSFRRISRPGQRIYIKATDIKKSRNGIGIYILSTSRGVMTGYEAHSLNIGGELICEVF